MIIEEFDTFKIWLTEALTPICDADPSALTNYVLALLKKDKQLEEVKQLCLTQLEVFLQDKNKEFVKILFDALATKSYIPTNSSAITEKEKKPVLDNERPEDRFRRHSRSRSPPPRPIDRRREERSRRRPPNSRYNDHRGNSGNDRHGYGRTSGRYNASYRRNAGRRFSGRSRSRSRERDRRSQSHSSNSLSSKSRSRSPINRGSRRSADRDSRGSTPLLDDTKPSNHQLIAHTDSGSAPVVTRRPRCKDYDEKGFCMRGDLCPFDHGSDPVVVDDVKLSSVLQFPVPASQQPPPPPAAPGTINAVATSLPLAAVVQPPIRPPIIPPQALPPQILDHRGPPPQRPVRPMSSLVPVHPPPPLQRPPLQRPPPAGYKPEPYNPEAPRPLHPGPHPPGIPMWGQNQGQPMNRLPSEMMFQRPPVVRPGHAPMDSSGTVSVSSSQSTEYTPHVAASSASENQYTTSNDLSALEYTPTAIRNEKTDSKHHRVPFNKLGVRRVNVNSDNSTLELRRVPSGLNTIVKLNEHFSQFGSITNLQIAYQSDPEAALITFQTHAQAAAAYRCPQPLFNNRFIKLFWHNKDSSPESGVKSGNLENKRLPVKDRLGAIPPAHKLQLNNSRRTVNNEKEKFKPYVSSAPVNVTRTVFNMAAIKQKLPITSRLGVSKDVTKTSPVTSPTTSNEVSLSKPLDSEKEARLKKAIRDNMDIRKKKQNLLEARIEEQKKLIKKLESKTLSADDKSSIIKTVKALAISIEALKKEISTQPKLVTGPNLANKQQAQKELLDAELDLISTQNKGSDTSELRRRVAALKSEASALGLFAGRGGRGRGSRGRGFYSKRGAMHGGAGSHLSVDRRPKQLLISGFTLEERPNVIAHMSSFGEVDFIEPDDDVPSLVIGYKLRQGAEKAVMSGAHFQDKLLIMRWHNPVKVNSTLPPQPSLIKSSPVKFIVDGINTGGSLKSGDADESGVVIPDDDLLNDELLADDNDGASDESTVDVLVAPDYTEEMDEDVLLGVDDDDDEEEEDKSWRH